MVCPYRIRSGEDGGSGDPTAEGRGTPNPTMSALWVKGKSEATEFVEESRMEYHAALSPGSRAPENVEEERR